MHKTKHLDVIGHVDNFNRKLDNLYLNGWCFNEKYPNAEIRLKYNVNDLSTEYYMDNLQFSTSRLDVSNYYNNSNLANCGWKFSLKIIDNYVIKNIEIQMIFENKWNTIFTFENEKENEENIFLTINSNLNSDSKNLFNLIITPIKQIPSFVVVDNFYEHVDLIRRDALKLNFVNHPDYHKGKRTEEVFRFKGLKESFEQILGNKIKNWENYGVNGCFQSCIGGDQLVYHYDTQEYAGILFLTPNAPPNTGTSFYRSKYTFKRKVEQKDVENTFKTGFLDSTQFDLVDIVGNVYNRLVLFDAQLIHAASNYFGDSLENGRLFQLFFFDLER